jgi:hypothetical protein
MLHTPYLTSTYIVTAFKALFRVDFMGSRRDCNLRTSCFVKIAHLSFLEPIKAPFCSSSLCLIIKFVRASRQFRSGSSRLWIWSEIALSLSTISLMSCSRRVIPRERTIEKKARMSPERHRISLDAFLASFTILSTGCDKVISEDKMPCADWVGHCHSPYDATEYFCLRSIRFSVLSLV